MPLPQHVKSVAERLWEFAEATKIEVNNGLIAKAEIITDVVYGIHSVREAVRTRSVDFVMITQGYHNPRLQEIMDACRAAGISLRFSPRHGGGARGRHSPAPKRGGSVHAEGL